MRLCEGSHAGYDTHLERMNLVLVRLDGDGEGKEGRKRYASHGIRRTETGGKQVCWAKERSERMRR